MQKCAPACRFNFFMGSQVVYFADFHLDFILQWLRTISMHSRIYSWGEMFQQSEHSANCLGKGLVNPPPSAQRN
jgi:hypothetical protein